MPLAEKEILSIVKSADELVELALSGKLRGAAIVAIAEDGSKPYGVVGQSAVELLGAIEWVKYQLVKSQDGR